MELYKEIIARSASPGPLVLGTVVETAGSTPQKPGCQSLLDERGAFLGTLGGGLVEDEAQRLMRAALADGQPRLFERRLDDDYSRTAGPICGGVMQIFINPKAAASCDAIRAALDAASTRRRAMLLTEIEGVNGSLGVIRFHDTPRNAIAGSAGLIAHEAVAKLLAEERPGVADVGEGRRVFVEPIVPAPRLLVVGGGHVGQAVARQMAGLGFEVTVLDDREEFSRAELFPEGVQTLRGNLRELVTNFPKDPDTYIVLVSKGHRPDAEALEGCIHSDLAYLGMIGSRRKVRMLRKHFIDDRLATEAEWDRLVAPIGYDIGAVSVPEIAISIAAQLIAARRLPHAVRDIAIKAI
jgi:xanthine dehydrogenase accessory factor